MDDTLSQLQSEFITQLATARAKATGKAEQKLDAEMQKTVEVARFVVKQIASSLSDGNTTPHVGLERFRDINFAQLADLLRPHDIQVSQVLGTSDSLAAAKEAHDWDGTQLPYTHFAHIGPVEEIFRHMRSYGHYEGELVKTY